MTVDPSPEGCAVSVWCPSENRKRPKTTRVDNRRNPLPDKGKRLIGLWFQGPHSVFTRQRSLVRSQ
jgi:hypothetical protein